jgi:transcriptional regulator with XRE-family HTH domain
MRRSWLPRSAWYQSVFILVPALPGSAPRAAGILDSLATTAPERVVIAPTNGSDLRRRELGSFLRNRRERLQPEQVGMRSSRRRRTPGLRREEVAQLAGVGVTWYTWLEQGRDINPSAQVLDAIARTLQFDSHEHSHLFTLAGIPTVTVAEHCLEQCPTAQALLDQLEPFPASLINDRLDLLAYNRVYASFFGDELERIPLEDRNLLWLAFTNPTWQKAIVDRDESVGNLVAEYRAAMAEHIDEPAWETLVARLHHASPEFTAFWERHDVQLVESRRKRALHPTAGPLTLVYTHLWLGQRLGTRITAFTPADEQTRRKLEALHASLTE